MALFFSALLASWPTLMKVLDLYIKTPTDKWNGLGTSILKLSDEIANAVESGRGKADYSDLEDLLRRRSS